MSLLLELWHAAVACPAHTHIVSVAQRVAEFVNFDAISFMFLWNILPKNYSSFVQHDHFVHRKMLCWTAHFTKVVQSAKNLKSVVVWVVTVRCSFQNGGTKECGRSNHVPPCMNKMERSAVLLWTINLSGCHTGHVPFEL